MINKLGVKTLPNQKVLVVFDAGIATEENLKIVAAKGFDYLCVSRSNLKSYKCDTDSSIVTTTAQNEAEFILQIRRCTDPNPNAKQPYDALKLKYAPFARKKSVVHKSST